MRLREVLLQVRQEIRFKLFVIAFCISLVSVFASSFLVLSLQRQQLIEETQQATGHLNDVIEAGLEYGMLRNDWALTNEILQSQVQASTFNRIQILNAAGLVLASSNPADIGKRLDRMDPACRSCHGRAGGSAGQTSIVTRVDGQEILWDVNRVRNREECQGCHDPQEAVLGLLVIEKPLTELPGQLSGALWRIVIAGAVTFGLMMGMLMFAGRRWVLKPLRAITDGVTAITAGDLDRPVAATGPDELGRLVAAFEQMRRQLQASQQEMERRNTELALLNYIALNTGQMSDPQQIMDLALETMVDRLGMDAGFIRLYDEELKRLTLRAARGVSPDVCDRIEQRRMGTGPDISQRVIETGQMVMVPDMAADQLFSGSEWTRPRAYINLPLKSRGAVIGTLVLWAHPGPPLQEHNLETLQAAGHEVGIAIDNALLLKEAQESEAEARRLYQLVAEISGSLEIPEVLQAVARSARQFLSADVAWVGLYDEDRETIVFEAGDGAGGEALFGLSVPVSNEWQNCCLKNPHWLHLPDLTVEHGLYAIRDDLARAGVASLITTPLSSRSRLHGVILAATRQPRHFRQKEVQRIDRLAQRVSDAVENARLYQKVGYLATLEERERLAREMHDRLAQALGYLHFQASVTDGLLRENQIAQARSSLQELKQVSHATYTDVREAIFNLRVALAAGLRFLPTLQEYVREYHRYYGVDVHLALDGVDLSCFSPDVDIQLLRIIQEALTNVRKHARASRVDIRFQKEPEWVKIVIEDNGCGFDPVSIAAEGNRSFGLQIMRERAEGVGGTMELVTAPGQGTQIMIHMPFEENYGEKHNGIHAHLAGG